MLKERRRECVVNLLYLDLVITSLFSRIRNRLGVKPNDLRCESFYHHPRVYVAKKLTELGMCHSFSDVMAIDVSVRVEENGTHIEGAFSYTLETV